MGVSVAPLGGLGSTVQGHKIRTYRFSFQGWAGNFAVGGRVCGVGGRGAGGPGRGVGGVGIFPGKRGVVFRSGGVFRGCGVLCEARWRGWWVGVWLSRVAGSGAMVKPAERFGLGAVLGRSGPCLPCPACLPGTGMGAGVGGVRGRAGAVGGGAGGGCRAGPVRVVWGCGGAGRGVGRAGVGGWGVVRGGWAGAGVGVVSVSFLVGVRGWCGGGVLVARCRLVAAGAVAGVAGVAGGGAAGVLGVCGGWLSVVWGVSCRAVGWRFVTVFCCWCLFVLLCWFVSLWFFRCFRCLRGGSDGASAGWA